jgi:hypothetical protein
MSGGRGTVDAVVGLVGEVGVLFAPGNEKR